DRALLVLLRRSDVAVGRNDLARRVDRLQLDLLDEDAGAVAVEHVLDALLRVRLDRCPVGRQDSVDGLQAHDLTHDALGHCFHRLARAQDVEHIVLGLGRIDLPVHSEVDVDNVLVAGQHLAFLGNVRDRARAAVADFGDLLIPDGNLDHRADRPGPVGVEAGGRLAGVPAEHEIDADLVGLNGVEGAPDEPDQDRRQNDEQDGAAAKAASSRSSAFRAAGTELAQSLLHAADDLFEVPRRRTRGPLPPWSAPRRAPWSAALIVPGHQILSLAAVRRNGLYRQDLQRGNDLRAGAA